MKLTSAQTWLIHSLETIAFGAIVTSVAILYPQVTDGTLTWQTLVKGVISAVVAVASKSGASILSNSQTSQALNDTVSQAVQAATPTPIVIHNNMPAAPARPDPRIGQAPVNLAPVTANQFAQPLVSTTAVQPLPSSGFTSLELPVVQAGQ